MEYTTSIKTDRLDNTSVNGGVGRGREWDYKESLMFNTNNTVNLKIEVNPHILLFKNILNQT